MYIPGKIGFLREFCMQLRKSRFGYCKSLGYSLKKKRTFARTFEKSAERRNSTRIAGVEKPLEIIVWVKQLMEHIGGLKCSLECIVRIKQLSERIAGV